MKTITILSIIIAFSIISTAQYTSVIDGNWTSPTTWSPVGVPVPGDDATINTNVILDTDFGYSSGTIIINASGTLIENIGGRSFAVQGGELNVGGTLDVTNFMATGGIFEITGTGTATTHIMFLGTAVDNYGFIDVDSLQNTVELNNYANATIDVFRFLNQGELNNAGVIDATDFYNDGELINNYDIYLTNYTNANYTLNNWYIEFNDFTNTGDFENDGSLYGTNDFTNTGYFEHYDDFYVANDFLNADSVDFEAYFYTESLVTIGNNWYNADTIEGTVNAQFCIQNETGNEGEMLGFFDFCDNTPPGTSPYIDINIGNIDAGITYCLTPCNTNLAKNADTKPSVNIYPNPFSYEATIKFENFNSNEKSKFVIYDITGKKVLQISELKGENIKINSADIGKGFYFYSITADNKIVASGKLIVE